MCKSSTQRIKAYTDAIYNLEITISAFGFFQSQHIREYRSEIKRYQKLRSIEIERSAFSIIVRICKEECLTQNQ